MERNIGTKMFIVGSGYLAIGAAAGFPMGFLAAVMIFVFR